MALPANFFEDVIIDIATTYGIVDGNDAIKTSDPVVKLATHVAYQQICAYAQVYFHSERRKVIFEHITRPTMLMHLPVGTVHSVTVDGVVWTTDQYKIQDDLIYLNNDTTVASDTCFSQDYKLALDYTAGVAKPDVDGILYSALILQGIANYNRRDLLGFTQHTGEQGASRSPSDSGGLLKAVEGLIAPLVYRGSGRVCST